MVMKNKSKTIVFFGNEQLATGLNGDCPTFKLLYGAGYNISRLIISSKPSTSRKKLTSSVVSFANEQQIPISSPQKTIEVIEQLRKDKPTLGVLCAYGKIVPQEIIDVFPLGIINLHPSLLPKHRGPTPIESVILNNEAKTGVSIMQLTSKMDAGPVYDQAEVTLTGDETKPDLAHKLQHIGAQMIIDLFPDIISNNITPIEQNHRLATYDKLIEKQDGIIDWNKPATRLAREIRAYLIWPGSKTKIGQTEVTITEAHTEQSDNSTIKPGSVVNTSTKSITIATGQDYLCITKLKPAGKKEMTAREFITGYKL